MSNWKCRGGQSGHAGGAPACTSKPGAGGIVGNVLGASSPNCEVGRDSVEEMAFAEKEVSEKGAKGHTYNGSGRAADEEGFAYSHAGTVIRIQSP